MSAGCSARFEISKEKIHVIAANPLKLSAGPCFSQKVIGDEKCLCFEKIERQLPERVPYQLWYILNDYDYFRGERQECLRIVQRKPPSELVMSFLAEQPVSARIVIRRQGERVVMMLAEEEEDDTEPIDSSTAVAEIGGAKYASLPEAFAAASNYDDTI